MADKGDGLVIFFHNQMGGIVAMKKSTLLLLAALVAGGAFADNYWTGRTLSDWSAEGAWAGSGNNVFGGNGSYLTSTDPHVVLFSKPETITRLWIENNDKGKIVWKLADEATEDAGLTMNGPNDKWGHAMNLGTGKHGELVIESGTYYNKGQLWLANGDADSQMTLNGGSYIISSYTCIAYGSGKGKGTLTVNGGLYKETGGAFIVSQSNNAGNIGEFNQTGGEVDVSGECFVAERAGKGIVNLTGGTCSFGGTVYAPRGNNTAAEITIDGGDLKAKSYVNVGYGQGSTATIDMKSGTFDTDNEMILGTATGANVAMTLSGGTFTPKKFWIASHYNHSNGGVTAMLKMTGGTLQTDNGQDVVVGGNSSATGTLDVQGGIVKVGETLHIGWRGHGVFNQSGGDVYVQAGKKVRLCDTDKAQSGSAELTGGTLHADIIDTTSGYGEKSFLVDGGTIAAVTSYNQWLSTATIKVGSKGIGLDASGFTSTLCANLVPADEEGSVKAVIKGSGTVNFAETTLAQIDTIAVADGGSIAFTMGDELTKPVEVQEGGGLTIDVTGIVTDGTYDLGTFAGGLTLAEGVTLSSDNVTLIGLPGSADAVYTLSDTGVLSVKLTGLEKLVWNSDNVEWGAENAWKGEKSGVVKTFGPTDKAKFIVEGDGEVQTVLVNDEIEPMGVEVVATGKDAYPLVKGHGTFKPQELSVKGTIAFAGDEEGALNLDGVIERTLEDEVDVSHALFESGTVNLLGSLLMDSTVNGTLVRETDWTPSSPITGEGEIWIKNCKLTLGTTQPLKNFAGTVRLGPNAQLDDAKDLNQAAVLGNGTLIMNGATILRFSWNDANEYLNDVIVVDGTENTWWNNQSRGNMGANVSVNGNISGGGKLIIRHKTWNARWIGFTGCDFTGFTGELEMHGINYYPENGRTRL